MWPGPFGKTTWSCHVWTVDKGCFDRAFADFAPDVEGGVVVVSQTKADLCIGKFECLEDSVG